MSARDLIAEGRRLLAAATPGPFAVLDDNGAFAHLQSLHRLAPGKDGWRERIASNMQSANAAWTAWLLNNGPALLDLVDSLGAVIPPPAAEGSRPGGEAAATPLAAPRRDVPDEDAATERRWRRALLLIRRDGCIYRTVCWATPDRARVDWCPACIADHALDPDSSSPETSAPGDEAARPEPSRDGDSGGSGRATSSP